MYTPFHFYYFWQELSFFIEKHCLFERLSPGAGDTSNYTDTKELTNIKNTEKVIHALQEALLPSQSYPLYLSVNPQPVVFLIKATLNGILQIQHISCPSCNISL